MANAGGISMAHPLQATAEAIGKAGGDPRVNRASLFMGANEGPAEIAAKITLELTWGANVRMTRPTSPTTRATRSQTRMFLYRAPYMAGLVDLDNRAHTKTVGGIPVFSDTFLVQKQQTFNRSKNLESMYRHGNFERLLSP
ncbi:MAG: hypothetical protein Q9208_004879 [Pyrenodesmia sp. 3 TL-2023]